MTPNFDTAYIKFHSMDTNVTYISTYACKVLAQNNKNILRYCF